MIAIATAADLFDIDRVSICPDLEAEVMFGSDGTPAVGEGLAMEVGGILGVSPSSAVTQIGAVLDVRHRHPALWEAFLEGHVWWQQAKQIARDCSTLSLEAVAVVDRQTRIAFGMGMGWGQIMYRLPAWVLEADPDLAREKEEQAREARYMRVGQIIDGCTFIDSKVG